MFNRKIFAVTSGLGVGAIGLMAFLFFGVSQAFPFFVGNVGDFMVTADTVEVDDFVLQFAIDENSGSNGSQMPAGEMNLGQATMQNMLLEKSFDAGSAIGDIPQRTWKFRLQVASPVTLNDAKLYASGLCGNELIAQGLEVDGHGANTPTFVDDFSMKADQLTLRGAAIQATYLAVSSLTLNSVTLTVEPGGYARPSCLP